MYYMRKLFRTYAGDRFIECSDARIAAMCFPRGKARSSRGAAVHKRTEREFSNFFRFYPRIYQLSNQIASIAPTG